MRGAKVQSDEWVNVGGVRNPSWKQTGGVGGADLIKTYKEGDVENHLVVNLPPAVREHSKT